MARRKKKKKTGWFGLGKSKTGRRKSKKPPLITLRTVLVAFGVMLLAGVIAAGFYFMSDYVTKEASEVQTSGPLILKDVPEWANEEFRRRVVEAAGGSKFRLEEATADVVYKNLSRLPWLSDIRVQVTHNSVDVHASYRLPVGWVDHRGRRYYIARDRTVLDYFPIDKIHSIQIVGYSSRLVPPTGRTWDDPDIKAGLEVIQLLRRMDTLLAEEEYSYTAQHPLRYEIKTIDVGNFAARRSNRSPHIVLIAQDGTQINWGAAAGESVRYLEPKMNEKIDSLYQFYEEHHTLQGIVKYIELRTPTKSLPRPEN